jgi:hypothetical protein
MKKQRLDNSQPILIGSKTGTAHYLRRSARCAFAARFKVLTADSINQIGQGTFDIAPVSRANVQPVMPQLHEP